MKIYIDIYILLIKIYLKEILAQIKKVSFSFVNIEK